MTTNKYLLLLIGFTFSFLSACAPSSEDACKAVQHVFERCSKSGTMSDQNFAECTNTLNSIATTNEKLGQSFRKDLKSCDSKQNCNDALSCVLEVGQKTEKAKLPAVSTKVQR